MTKQEPRTSVGGKEMETWEVTPNVSVGGIRFGMSRAELRALFGDEYEVFRKPNFSENTTDDYHRFHVYYTPEDLVESVMVFYGDGIELTLNGTVIFPVEKAKVEEVMPGITGDEDYPTDYQGSIGYGEDAGEEDELFDFILIGREGYFNTMH